MSRIDKIMAWVEELDVILADTKETLRSGASRHGDSFSDVVMEPLERIEQARHLLFSLPYRESIETTSRDRLLPDNENYLKGYVAGYSDAYGDVGALKAKLNELKSAKGWQPIDSAPKDGTKVDLWVRIRPSKMDEPESYECFPASWWDSDRDDWKLGRMCWHSKFYADAHIPTNWMPSPTAPEESV